MNSFTYSTSNLPSKDVLAISSLLSLFEHRLSAKWVMRNHPSGQSVDIVVVDLDRPGGAEVWKEPGVERARVALTEDDRAAAKWLVTRPIRAYGNNGVVVLFNSIAEALLGGPAVESPPPPPVAQVRPVAASFIPRPRVEPPPPPPPVAQPRPVPPVSPPPVAAPPPPPPKVEPPPNPPAVAARPPDKKWGPPEPVVLSRLSDMPANRDAIAEKPAAPPLKPPESKPVPPAAPAPPPSRKPNGKWHPPDPIVLPDLVDMRTGRWISGRTAPVTEKPPVAKTSPPVVLAPAPPPPPALVAPEPAPVQVQPIEIAESVPVATPVDVAAPVETEPVVPIDTAAPAAEPPAPPQAAEEVEADWWGSPEPVVEALYAPPEQPPAPQTDPGDSDLPALLKEIRRSEKIGLLEIGGLPGVCVVPARRVYYTTAPLARLEAAIAARAKAAFRVCASEPEARRLSETESSRPSNLSQLYWAAALISPTPLPSAFAEDPLRLKAWPPVTSSSGGGHYLRYATLLSGGAVNARQLATLTSSDPKEVIVFLQACADLGLLETGHSAKRTAAVAPGVAGKVGVLRSMIEQLAPPKI